MPCCRPNGPDPASELTPLLPGGHDVQCVKQKHSLDRAIAGLAAGLHVLGWTGFDDTVSMGRNRGCCRAVVLPCPALSCLLPSYDMDDDDGSVQPPPHPASHMAEHPLAACTCRGGVRCQLARGRKHPMSSCPVPAPILGFRRRVLLPGARAHPLANRMPSSRAGCLSGCLLGSETGLA